jgi:PAS domain-containing protein
MSIPGLLSAFGAVALAVVMAGAIIAGLSQLMRRSPVWAGTGSAPPPDDSGTVLLFQGGLLADATPAGRRMIAAIRSDAPSLAVVAGHLARRFPGLRERIRRIEDHGRTGSGAVVDSGDGTERLHIDAGHGHIRLTVAPAAGVPAAPNPARITELEDELRTLRSLAEDAPQLIWQQDRDGSLIWANRAYLALADRILPRSHGDDPLWPAQPVLPAIGPVTEDGARTVTRVQVELPGLVEPQTYEVTSVGRGPRTVHFAVDASNIIAAEEGRQKFIQTLTKTFAHLSAGLAIFDRERRLVLFNPAFLDLTTLPPLFLSQRPAVGEVLDRLRDLQMLPEPKDYSSWRDRVAALEAAAVRGTYCETWSLPSGRTYRVSGRPHPDGAIAFLFEDVSDEILLTRHFRSELETAQSVLDSLDEAVAVFSRAGTLTMNNATYTELWGRGTAGLTELGLTQEIAAWQAGTQPTSVWDRLSDSAADLRDRTRWQDVVRTTDGRNLMCRFQPLAGGGALIAFRPHIAEAPRLGQSDQPRRPRAVSGS